MNVIDTMYNELLNEVNYRIATISRKFGLLQKKTTGVVSISFDDKDDTTMSDAFGINYIRVEINLDDTTQIQLVRNSWTCGLVSVGLIEKPLEDKIKMLKILEEHYNKLTLS